MKRTAAVETAWQGFTPGLIDAWLVAYQRLAAIMSIAEADLCSGWMEWLAGFCGQTKSAGVAGGYFWNCNNKYYTGISPVGKEAFIYEFDPAGGADSFKKGLALDGGGYMQVQLIAPNPTK